MIWTDRLWFSPHRARTHKHEFQNFRENRYFSRTFQDRKFKFLKFQNSTTFCGLYKPCIQDTHKLISLLTNVFSCLQNTTYYASDTTQTHRQTDRLQTTHSFANNAVLSLCKHQCTQCVQCVWMQIRRGISLNARQNSILQVTKYSTRLLQNDYITEKPFITFPASSKPLHCASWVIINNLFQPTTSQRPTSAKVLGNHKHILPQYIRH